MGVRMKLPEFGFFFHCKSLDAVIEQRNGCKAGVFIGVDAQLASNRLVVYVNREK